MSYITSVGLINTPFSHGGENGEAPSWEMLLFGVKFRLFIHEKTLQTLVTLEKFPSNKHFPRPAVLLFPIFHVFEAINVCIPFGPENNNNNTLIIRF